MFGQNQKYINPNAAFDLGVSLAQLNFNHSQGTLEDQYQNMANRAEDKFRDITSPRQSSVEIDPNNSSSFNFSTFSQKVSQIQFPGSCNVSYTEAADLIFAAGFNLA